MMIVCIIQEVLKQASILEFFGVSFSILQVIFALKNNSKNYIFGIIGVLLTMYLMYISRLYAEFALNIYYLIMSIYGWYYWHHGKDESPAEITFSTPREWLITLLIIVFSFLIFYFTLTLTTDTDVPMWDSSVSAFAWSGMWLMAKRKIENWIILNLSNLLAIPLMIYKELYLYSFLSSFLFIMAIFGFINWIKIIKNRKQIA